MSDDRGDQPRSAVSVIVMGAVAALLAVTPLMPAAAVLAVVGLVRASKAAAGAKRTWARFACGVALVVCVVMTPLYLVFLDDSGLLRK